MPRTTAPLGRVFDARPDRVDFRDLEYRPPVRSLPPRWPAADALKKHFPRYVKDDMVLDQGSEGACTGFGLACVVNYLRWSRAEKATPAKVSPRMLYELARRYDEWPGEQYDGSSCRGALKGWHKHGVCTEAGWPYRAKSPKSGWETQALACPLGVYYRIDRTSVVDMQAAIAEIGAIYVSARVHDGWNALPVTPAPATHAAMPGIAWPKTSDFGGHAFALVGYNECGFIVQNSWGGEWAAGGFAVLPYDDWTAHGDDAWVVGLGVPVRVGKARKAAMRWPVPSGRALGWQAKDARNPANPSDDPWPVDHEYLHAPYRPWSTAMAYEHTLVTGNDGSIEVSDLLHPLEDPAAYVRHIAYELPHAALKNRASPKLVLYAHGGLNSETTSIARIRMLAPYFEANDIYPLFLTWKTGPLETLVSMVSDVLAPKLKTEEAFAAGIVRDALDRLAEQVARIFLRGFWTEMRENAARGALEGHGLEQLAGNLVALTKDLPKLEVHFVGHSAGAILLGHLLPLLRAQAGSATTRARPVSCTLLAPACSVRFARAHYGAAMDAGQLDPTRLALHVLSDKNDKDDGLPSPNMALYGKSLLYFVSRALDDVRKMPLLGFERAALRGYEDNDDSWDEDELPELQAWLDAFRGTVNVVSDARVRVSREGHTIQATHGSFDNNIAVVSATIEALKGEALAHPVEWLDY